MGGEVWRMGVERGTEAEQQREKDTEAGGERKKEMQHKMRVGEMRSESIHECVE